MAEFAVQTCALDTLSAPIKVLFTFVKVQCVIYPIGYIKAGE